MCTAVELAHEWRVGSPWGWDEARATGAGDVEEKKVIMPHQSRQQTTGAQHLCVAAAPGG